MLPLALAAAAAAASADEAALRALNTRVLAEAGGQKPSAMLAAHARAAIQAANRRETAAWREVESREDWERLRDRRVALLGETLKLPPPLARGEPESRVTGTIEGEGFRIEKLVFVSRPGLLVTANFYLPEPAPARPMPAILICHSHHHPKEESELEDMGVSWARAGAAVLVLDQLGHGERRLHPFVDARSFPRPFRAGRQDYHFRYNAGLQLQALGEELFGWMAWDLMRGVDLLVSRPGVDERRILLLGSVAGGGDPAAVAAALDPRIAAAAPFNFGGPQPETRYPLPADAEDSFDYAGGGSWESTRNLRLSARHGFLPWTIVAAIAPRGLIYAHEFSWDRERDPVWRRLESIYGFYGAPERLAFAHGRGTLTGNSPDDTHCNNIGAEHRRWIHQAFSRWFEMPPPAEGPRSRRPAAELRCLSEETAAALEARPFHEILLDLARSRAEEARRSLGALPAEARRLELRSRWASRLGEAVEAAAPRVVERRREPFAGGSIERVALETEEGIVVPLLLLLPAREGPARPPVVLAFAQEGKRVLLDRRAAAAARLLEGGAALCLPDLRGTGETAPADSDRGRRGAATAISSSYLMLGRTLLGARLRDLRAVLAFLRSHPEVDASRAALWGDSFAPANPPERELALPLEVEPWPAIAEPLGGALAALGALFEDGIAAVYARGGLESYESLLRSPFLYVPHDAIVPGAILDGDLTAVRAALAPESALFEDTVDALNRKLEDRAPAEPERLADWMLSRLKR
jgi:dienelactone hydrolase